MTWFAHVVSKQQLATKCFTWNHFCGLGPDKTTHRERSSCFCSQKEDRPSSFSIYVLSITTCQAIGLYRRRFQIYGRIIPRGLMPELAQNRFPLGVDATTGRISFCASATFVFTTPPIALTRNERGMRVRCAI